MPPTVNNPYQIESELLDMIKDVKQYYHQGKVWESKILSVEQFKQVMINKYEYLSKSSEGLFMKCLANEFREKQNLVRIQEMLHHLKNIYNGKVKQEAVDRHIGAKYAKEYVDPLINKLDSDKK